MVRRVVYVEVSEPTLESDVGQPATVAVTRADGTQGAYTGKVASIQAIPDAPVAPPATHEHVVVGTTGPPV